MNHLEFAAIESAELVPTNWERWVKRAENALGHDLDGDQSRDGYSLDFAYDAFRAGMTVREYVSTVR